MSKQGGYILPQLVIAVILVSLFSAYFGKLYMDRTREHARDERARLVGARLALLDNAAESYAMKYSSQIQMQERINNDGYDVPTERLRKPTPDDLSKLGILSAGAVAPVLYGDRNIDFQLEFTVPGIDCTPPGCDVAYLIKTTQPLMGTNGQVDVRRLTVASSMANPARTGVSLPDSVGGRPDQFVGKDGVLIADNVGSNPGLLAVKGGFDNQEFDAFVRRDGSLHMTGNLNFDQHNINNVGSANFSGEISTKSMNATDNVSAKSLKARDGGIVAEGGNIVAERGNIVAAGGDIVASNNIRGRAMTLTMKVKKGMACDESNQVAVNSDEAISELLICQNNVWSSVGAKLKSYTRKFEDKILGGLNRPTINVWCDPGDVVTSGSVTGHATSGLRAVAELSEPIEDIQKNVQGWAGRFAYNAMKVNAVIIARCLTVG
jgi:hypothetical protein